MQVPVFTDTLDVRDTAAIEALPSRLPPEFAEVVAAKGFVCFNRLSPGDEREPGCQLKVWSTNDLLAARYTWPQQVVVYCAIVQVDILVNNAGLALGTAPVTEISVEVQ